MNVHDMASALGRLGGRARARRLSPDHRRQIASLGGVARARSLEAARRVEVNLRYAATMELLRGGPGPVVRMKRFDGPLPGIYCVKP